MPEREKSASENGTTATYCGDHEGALHVELVLGGSKGACISTLKVDVAQTPTLCFLFRNNDGWVMIVISYNL